jgi:hypothetical protein
MTSQALHDEVVGDPLGRGYSGMTNQEVADDMNTVYRTRNRATMTASEVFNSIDKAEYNAIPVPENKQMVWDILHLGDVNPFGLEADLFVDVFGGGSNTITALQAARVESISRATELGVNATAGAIDTALAQYS